MAAPEPTTEIVMDEALGTRTTPQEMVRLPPLDSWRMERSFSQQSRLHRFRRSFSLFNGHFLELREGRRGHERRAVYNLAFLESQPRTRRFIAWRWVGVTALMLAAGVGVMWAGFLLAGSGILAAAALTLFQALRRSRYQLVFYSYVGGVPLFVLEPEWLVRGDAHAFAALLSERIEDAHWLLPRGRDRLAAIMAEHRRLHESGCLSQRRYERAKRRIMEGFSRT